MKPVLLLSLVISSLFGGRPAAAAEIPATLQVMSAVPDDAAFTMVLRDFADRRKTVLGSGSLAAILRTPFVRRFAASPEFARLADMEKRILGELGTSRVEILDDAFGEMVVFSWMPGDKVGAEPRPDRGLFLFALKDADRFDKLLARIHEVQKTAGELKELREIRTGDIAYWHRVKATGGDEYCVREGRVFIHASEPKLLERAVVKLRRTKADDAPAFASRLKSLGLDSDLFVWWIDPRKFDAEFAAGMKKAGAQERILLDSLVGNWAAITDLWVRVDVRTALEVSIGMKTDPKKWPAPPANAKAVRASLWSVVPEDSLLAIAGSVDLVQVLHDIGNLMTADEREKARAGLLEALDRGLGRGRSAILEKGLGKEWGVWVWPAKPDAGWFPSVLVPVPLGDTPAGAKAGDLLYDSLSLLGGLLRLNYPAIVTERENAPEGELRYLKADGLFPTGFRPTWGVRGNYLVIASSPEVLRGFVAPKPVPVADEVPIARISFTAWKAFLDTRDKEAAEWLAIAQKSSAKDIRRDLTEFRENIAPFDKLELGRTYTRERFGLTLRLTPAPTAKEPLP